MLLRALAIFLSLLMHGLIGLAIWPRLEQERLDVLDLGMGPDIVLAPQGMVMSEVTNLGDDVQSIETHDVVPIEQQEPPPAPAVTSPQQLHDVGGYIESKKTLEVAAVQAQKPTPQRPTAIPAKQLPDVVASEKSTVEQEIGTLTGPVAGQIQESKVVDGQSIPDHVEEPSVASVPEAPEPNQIEDSKVAQADEPSAPNQLRETRAAKADLPPPDELRQPKITEADEPRPDKALEEREPEAKEVLAQPEQVAIVTEQSSGEEKTGGDARIIGIYLGKINARVQRSKVNPHSRQTGSVVLKFTIGIDGSLLSKQIASSSGSRVLDNAALAAIDRAAPFPAIPEQVSMKPMAFTQLFRFVVR